MTVDCAAQIAREGKQHEAQVLPPDDKSPGRTADEELADFNEAGCAPNEIDGLRFA